MTTPEDLIQLVKNVNKKQADQIIKGANHALMEMIDTASERLEEMKDIMKCSKTKINKSS